MPTVNSVTYNKPVLPRVSDTSDLASNRASVYSGKALDFDGVNDYVLVNNFSFNPLSSDFTFSTYVRVDELKDGKIAYAEKGSNDSQLAAWQVRTDSNGDLYFQSNTDTWYTINWSGFSTEIKDRVVHLTFVRVGTSVNLYLNGKLYGDGYGSIPTTLASGNGRFCIGNRLGVSNYLNGIISDYKIFDVALTATQVAELYNNPEQILPTGVSAVNLKLWLPMMEGAGSYVYNGAAGATGAELLANGTLEEVCQKWGLSDVSTIAITGGKIIWTNPASGGAFADQYISVSTGKTYRITFDYSASDGGFVYIGNQYTSIPSGTGTFTVDIAYTSGDARLRIAYGSANALTASVDNVSVKEVVPQATGTISGATWVAGVGEPVPQTALIDWNKYDSLETAGSSNYYSGNITIGSSGTIICRHIPYNRDNAYYYYGLGSNNTGYQRAVGSYDNKYWIVGYGNSPQDFTSNAPVDLGFVTDISNSWDADHNVTIHKNGNFVQTTSKTLANIAGTRTVVLYRSAWSNGNRQSIIFWAYYDRKLTTEEINDVYNGVVEPTALSDLKYYFTPQNNYSYDGVTLTKTGTFTNYLAPEALTASKDIFGSDIANPRSAGAFNLDGKSYASFQPNASLEIANNITLEFWAKFSVVTTGSTNYDHVIGRRDGNSNWLRVYRHPDNSIKLEGDGGSAVTTSSGLYNEVWYHYVATLSGTSGVIYLDGTQVSTGNIAWSIVGDARPWTIGGWDIGYLVGDSYTFGDIANPRIYNYALTAEQVADNFNQKASTFGKSSVTSELQAYINRTVAAGATVEAHPALLNTLTELENK